MILSWINIFYGKYIVEMMEGKRPIWVLTENKPLDVNSGGSVATYFWLGQLPSRTAD